MPRLPSEYDINAPRWGTSGRPIASVDTTAVGEGMQAVAKGLANVGDTINAYVTKEKTAKDNLEATGARSSHLTNWVKLDEERDNLDDPEKLKLLGDRYKEARDTAANAISDPTARQKYILDTEPELERRRVAVGTRVKGIERDKYLASSQQDLDNLKESGLKTNDEAERVKIIDAGKARIDAIRDAGYITEQQAVSMKKKWAESYAVSRLNMMAPEERMDALRGDIKPTEGAKSAYNFFVQKGWTPVQAAGIVGNLMQESSMNPKARNAGDGSDGSDSIGVGQWNSDRAARLKRFAAQRGTDWHDLNTQLEFVDLELRTSEGKAGKMLMDAKDVRSATAAMVMYERPAGSNRGAEQADGWGNRYRHAQTFHNAFGGGAAPERPKGVDVASILPTETRYSMFNDARNEYRSNQNRRDHEFRQEIQAVKNLINDDLASIRTTGKPVAELTVERVESAQGPEAAKQFAQAREAEQTYYGTVKDFGTMTNEQIRQSVEATKPEGGSAGYTDKFAVHMDVQKEAKRIIKMREEDPASVVDAQPSVRAVREKAEYTGSGPERRITPVSAQAIVRERMTAQEALGIETPRPVTMRESEVLAGQLRAIGDDDTKALNGFIKSLEATYGPYAPLVLAAVLEAQGVRRDLANAATTVLQSIVTKNEKDARAWSVIEGNRRWPAPAPTPDASALAAMAPPQAMQPVYDGFLPQTPVAPGAVAKPGATYDARDLRWLWENRNDPNAMTEFDMRYGGGSADAAMKDLTRRMTGKKATANGK